MRKTAVAAAVVTILLRMVFTQNALLLLVDHSDWLASLIGRFRLSNENLNKHDFINPFNDPHNCAAYIASESDGGGGAASCSSSGNDSSYPMSHFHRL